MSESPDTTADLDNLHRGRFHDRLIIVAQQLFATLTMTPAIGAQSSL
jgi:hypothetical protein